MKRIILIGYRASGKSTLASMLKKELKVPVYSVDKLIEEHAGLTIAEIVKKEGWEYFRDLEKEVIANLPRSAPIIVDCGGGVVEDDANMKYLLKNSIIIWVDANLEDIMKRMKNDSETRPLLSENSFEKDIQNNYWRRKPLYEKYSHLRVNTSVESMFSIIKKIKNYLGLK